jgi:hypothetical protein
MILVAVAASFCVLACGASRPGANTQPQRSSAQGSPASTGATIASATNARAYGRLKGDEDDDDDHSATYKANGNFDKDVDFDDDVKDNAHKGYRDRDDGPAVGFGHPASAADHRAIKSVVKRYFAAAAADDATTACSLTFSLLADALSEDYGHAPGPLYLRNAKSCKEIFLLLFKHLHTQIVWPFKVTSVRVRGLRAYALLGSPTMPASMTELRRELGVWKLDQVLSTPLS